MTPQNTVFIFRTQGLLPNKYCYATSRFIEVDDQPTGSCVALVLGSCRCLCADIGAASICEPEHVFTSELIPLLEESDFIYVEGYFITHSFNTALQLARYARDHQKTFVFNLCGSYVCENHPNELAELLPYVDILFGFAEEYKTLDKFVDMENIAAKLSDVSNTIIPDICKALRVLRGTRKVKNKDSNTVVNGDHCFGNGTSDSSDLSHCAGVIPNAIIDELCNGISNEKISDLDDSSVNTVCGKRLQKQRLVVVTNGPNPLLYIQNGTVLERQVPPISAKKIVDTTGAGDSFVGGFLAALSRGLPLDQCLDCGTWTAQQLLQQKGCTLPTYPATFLSKD